MNIKKVDDKPMVIHTKEKMTIHKHGQEDIPKREKSKKQESKKQDSKKQSPPKKNKGMRQSHQKNDIRADTNKSIKAKFSSIKLAGVAGVKVATDQMEGGEEVQRASGIAYGVARTTSSGIKKGATISSKVAVAAKKRRIRKVEAGKKFAKKRINKAVSSGVKKTVKKTAKETAKTTVKVGAKVGAGVVGTAAGTATTGVGGVAIGMAAGKVVGDKLDRMDVAATNKERVFKFFLDKMNAEHKQSDSVGKLVKDLFANRAKLFIMKAIMPIVSAFLGFFLLIAIACIPVVLVVALLYNSPFALFLPPLEAGDTVLSITKEYESDFNRRIDQLVAEHVDCDKGDKIYVDYEGSAAVPSNVYDVVAVYMVKYGVGDTAAVMTDLSKQRLKTVFDDMCSYTTSVESKSTEQEDGTTKEEKILHVKVHLKSYQDMISMYRLTDNEVEMLEQIMSPENMAMLGCSDDSSENSQGETASKLSDQQIAEILQHVTNQSVKKTLAFALSKVGYPYSQVFRDSGKYYDCSSLAYYSWKAANVDISFGGATTAAAEGQVLNEADKDVALEDKKPGDLIFYSYCQNGRYKNISHVAIYVGDGKVVEAANERIGVVYRDIQNQESIVLVGRP